MADNKIIEVGGRLHSIATGNVLAGANEILDDAKGKKQSVVNAENDIQLASHESRLNAYTEGKFVTVSNYSALPATGAVDTVYRVSSWDGTANNGQGAVDVTKYSEYAWQNGAYKFLDVKTQIGEVFDISEYNSGAVYTDLANALGNNGINVPSSIRRGGMSVKFKQVITPAKYTVVKTEGLTEQPTGTELQSDPGIISGTYTSGELNVFSTLPATLNSSLTYYLAVTETVDEQEVTTYTTWVIPCTQISYNKYVQFRYIYTAITGDTNPFLDTDNWQKEFTNSDIFDKNTEETRKIGYEITSAGNYSQNSMWNSSGDMYLSEDLQYETNCSRYIYCYDANGDYIGRVDAGQSLLENTTHVRINWLRTEEPPYFYSHSNALQLSIDSHAKRLEELKNSVNEQSDAISSIRTSINLTNTNLSLTKKDLLNLVKEININVNVESEFHIGYELNSGGNYIVNASYNSSGDIKVNDNLLYITDYAGNIFCFGSNGFISKVASGLSLPEGTTYVRLNWKKTQEAPCFYAISNYSIHNVINQVYKVNGNDLLGYELLMANGKIKPSPNYRTTQFIRLETGKNYKCNRSGRYYYYDAGRSYLGTVTTTAGTIINNSSYTGAVFVRMNAPVANEIIVNEVDGNGNPVLQYYLFNGLSKSVLDKKESEANANVTVIPGLNLNLPDVSSNVEVRFKTNQSIYKLSEEVELFTVENFVTMKLVPRTVTESLYCDKSEVNLQLDFPSSTVTIPLRMNFYGTDLFSIRIKYPIVNVAADGRTTMVTPMPSAYEGMYIEKTDTQFIIHNGDDTVFKSWNLSDYTDVDAFVEALKIDTDVTDVFEIKKFGCEGTDFSEINNFSKIELCEEHTEILYSGTTRVYTGNEYWDSYPTFIRTSDVGYEHILKFNYRVIDGVLSKVYVSFDGLFIRAESSLNKEMASTMVSNVNGIISQITNVSVLPYKTIRTPLISMQHAVHVNDNLESKTMVTTTMRQYDMLAYLKKKGFIGQNFTECMSSVRGSLALDKPTYCLVFDDIQNNIWTDKRIRDIFNQFRAKPTFAYIIKAEYLDSVTPPSYAFTSDEYKDIKNSEWDIVAHGFCQFTQDLSYAQFNQGFIKTKEAWLRWYNEDVQSYNPHGGEIEDYQYFMLKHMGFHSISTSAAPLGYYCECGTQIDVEYKRVNWMDNEYSWSYVKSMIDKYCD